MTSISPSQREDLRQELLSLIEEDNRLREELASNGSLYEGYHPKMEEIHIRNAARLAEIIDEIGWPSTIYVGQDGAEAAWCIAQHAIGNPGLQRKCLEALKKNVVLGYAPAWQAAMLEDRIRMFEGKPQIYGTQLEPDQDGKTRPYWTQEPELVEERRKSVGLEPLADRLAREPIIPIPSNKEQFEKEYQEWLRRVGWRS
ncbi:MAG: hypothetical protein HY819_19750 [Acidobacteria bacterium]|nr:hypothetical protein [Acidobacteriota bacterium]